MAATISLLNSDLIRWKLLKFSAAPPSSATALFSRQVFPSNTLRFDANLSQRFLKPSVSTKYILKPCHVTNSTTCFSTNHNDHLVDDKLITNSSSCSIFNFFGDHFVDVQLMFFKILKSFVFYGVLAIMAMAMALCSQNSALAASYGRMGGSYKSSSGSSSRSSGSSSWSWSQPSYLSPRSSSSVYISTPSSSLTADSSTPSSSKSSTPSSLSSSSSSSPSYSSRSCSSESEPKVSKSPNYILRFGLCALVALVGVYAFFALTDSNGPFATGSVLMLQVGISDKKRVLQKKLNIIADSADTSTVDGLNYILKEVVKALLRHNDSCRFAYIYDKCGDSMNKSVKPRFEELLDREIKRHDKDRNTFLNKDGVKFGKKAVGEANIIDNEYTVVTLLVLAFGMHLYSSANTSTENIKSLMQTFQSIPKSKLETVEVFWTPQREDETVSEQEVRQDFPLMKQIESTKNDDEPKENEER